MKFESQEKLRLILLKSSNEVIDIHEQEGKMDYVVVEEEVASMKRLTDLGFR